MRPFKDDQSNDKNTTSGQIIPLNHNSINSIYDMTTRGLFADIISLGAALEGSVTEGSRQRA